MASPFSDEAAGAIKLLNDLVIFSIKALHDDLLGKSGKSQPGDADATTIKELEELMTQLQKQRDVLFLKAALERVKQRHFPSPHDSSSTRTRELVVSEIRSNGRDGKSKEDKEKDKEMEQNIVDGDRRRSRTRRGLTVFKAALKGGSHKEGKQREIILQMLNMATLLIDEVINLGDQRSRQDLLRKQLALAAFTNIPSVGSFHYLSCGVELMI